MVQILPEPHGADATIEALLDRAFGPARMLKTAQRLRDGRLPIPGLSFVAVERGRLVGTLRFWNLELGHGADALLLGPIGVEPALAGTGVGSRLIRHGLSEASRQGHPAVILVGDPGYYGRFGFAPHRTQALSLPGPFERHRLLGLEIRDHALAGARGLVRPAGPADPTWRRPRAA